MTSTFNKVRVTCALIGLCVAAGTASAADTYLHGHINNVTFAGESLMIKLDAGLPDNCAGTSYGWMEIPATYKSMTAFVIGLWMRGDSTQTLVTVYTQGLVGGYCRVTQVDPEG